MPLRGPNDKTKRQMKPVEKLEDERQEPLLEDDAFTEEPTTEIEDDEEVVLDEED